MDDENGETLHIKNMVCERCIRVVTEELERLGLKVERVELGTAEVVQPLQPISRERIREVLEAAGFGLLEDRLDRIMERVKNEIIQTVRRDANQEPMSMNFSDYLATRLRMDYNYLSTMFSVSQGISIEQYIIRQKIERAKELLMDGELNLSEIAYKLGYSSVQHLSSQFRKIAGMTASSYRESLSGRRPLDKIT